MYNIRLLRQEAGGACLCVPRNGYWPANFEVIPPLPPPPPQKVAALGSSAAKKIRNGHLRPWPPRPGAAPPEAPKIWGTGAYNTMLFLARLGSGGGSVGAVAAADAADAADAAAAVAG